MEWEANGPDQLASHSIPPLTVRTDRSTSPRRRYITVEGADRVPSAQWCGAVLESIRQPQSCLEIRRITRHTDSDRRVDAEPVGKPVRNSEAQRAEL